MYIGNNFRVAKKTLRSVWHEAYFIDEKSAREYANEAYMTGAVVVELWQRGRGGYRLVKQVKEHQKVAEAKYNAYMAAKFAGCNIEHGAV